MTAPVMFNSENDEHSVNSDALVSVDEREDTSEQ